MNFDNLKNIYQFAEHHQKEEYWQNLFQYQSSTPLTITNSPSIKNSNTFPACDIYQKDNYFYIDMEIPGMDSNQIQVSLLDNNILEVKGYYRSLQENCAYYLKERQNLQFTKQISLPTRVEEHNLQSSYKKGIYTIYFRQN
ncbi:Hsp20/alpha crystallin family protein [Niallia nealsonii]|nr:Hsp20/alpha crystallin family protein [Niallia nealsonii]